MGKFKIVYLILSYIGSFIYIRFTGGPFKGVWCNCWQIGDRMQVGTLVIKNCIRVGRIQGVFYSGERVWDFEAKYNKNRISGRYIDEDGDSLGEFHFTDFVGEKKIYKMNGAWGGKLSSKKQNEPWTCDGFHIFAARSTNKISVETGCMKKNQSDFPEGTCFNNFISNHPCKYRQQILRYGEPLTNDENVIDVS